MVVLVFISGVVLQGLLMSGRANGRNPGDLMGEKSGERISRVQVRCEE